LAYQPPANSTFLSEQISHQQSASSTFLSKQISISHQPPAKRTTSAGREPPFSIGQAIGTVWAVLNATHDWY
jgi:hypothetical protein